VLVLALLGVVAAAALGRVDRVLVAVPVVLLLGWLGACRVMVRRERRWRPAEVATTSEQAADAQAPTAPAETPAVEAAAPDPDLWDPVPVTLPTYVSKPPARRAVRTIDLDATGVWTSGRTESDTALAREADAAQAAERGVRRTARTDPQNGEAVGS
jgi:pyruvate/2-oxoglutarate dehydrogenase complex dihydrolipoamide acyltransferase (E2) component